MWKNGNRTHNIDIAQILDIKSLKNATKMQLIEKYKENTENRQYCGHWQPQNGVSTCENHYEKVVRCRNNYCMKYNRAVASTPIRYEKLVEIINL